MRFAKGITATMTTDGLPPAGRTTSTSAMNRYPLPATVSMNDGAAGESFNARRIFRIAVLTPVSTSTKTSLFHSRSMMSAREINSPRCVTSRISKSIGCRSSRTGRPRPRSS